MRINVKSVGFALKVTDDAENLVVSYTLGPSDMTVEAGLLISAIGELALRKQAVDNELADNERPDPIQSMIDRANELLDRLNAKHGNPAGMPDGSDAPDIDAADSTGNNPNDPESPVGKL